MPAAHRVLLQAGHSDQFPPYAAGGGGAPGEAEWTADLARRIAEHLRAAGVEVVIVGAWLVWREVEPGVRRPVELPPPAEALEDYSGGCWALHYDAPKKLADGSWATSGCAWARAALDPLGAESDRLGTIWARRYPAALGIALQNALRVGPGMTDYYAFRATTARTAGLILEHGCGSPVPVGDYPAGGDAARLRASIDLVAQTDACTILEGLGLLPPSAPSEAPWPDPPLDSCAQVWEYARALEAQVAAISADRDTYAAGLATCNAIKAAFERELRHLENRRRLRRGRTDALIAAAS